MDVSVNMRKCLQIHKKTNSGPWNGSRPEPSMLQVHDAVKSESCSFFHSQNSRRYRLNSTMSKARSESSEDFEFIETPAAPTPIPPVEDCGVRTTSVRPSPHGASASSNNKNSTQPSRMLLYRPMPLEMTPSIIISSSPCSALRHGTSLGLSMVASGPRYSSSRLHRSQS